MSQVPTPSGCPEPSIIAAFVEGTLDATSRKAVEQHIADCPECPLVVAETARFLRSDVDENDGDADPPARHTWWWLTAAAVAALCIPAVLWQVAEQRDPLRRVKKIAAELPTRPVEGRLAGFDHVPFKESRGDQPDRGFLLLQAEAERLDGEDDINSRTLHARAVALLLIGEEQRALPAFEEAAGRKPEDAVAWSDLSAALIAAGTTGDRQDLSRAVAAADRALTLSPSLAAAHLNRGIAFEHLGRPDKAADAYRRALELEPRSEWRNEIADRLSRVQP